MTSRPTVLGLALLLAASPVWGQSAPSLPVNPRILGSGTDTLAVFLVRGTDTARTGTIIDQWQASGDRLMRVYATVDRVLGNGLDTIVSSITDLRPVRYRTRSVERIADLTFSAGRVEGWMRLPNGDSTPVAVGLPSVVYDGASFDLILRASPLREGLELGVPSFLLGPNTVSLLTASVSGTVKVDGRACWIVKADFAGMPVSFWVDKETRILRRQVMQPRVGMQIIFAHATATPNARRAT